ncbi:MAG TPA: hypothetical protein VGJ84_09945 [Polyangiaceae bacterium]
MKYVAKIEERDGVLMIEVLEQSAGAPLTVALLSCVVGPSGPAALRELVRLAFVALPRSSTN